MPKRQYNLRILYINNGSLKKNELKTDFRNSEMGTLGTNLALSGPKFVIPAKNAEFDSLSGVGEFSKRKDQTEFAWR